MRASFLNTYHGNIDCLKRSLRLLPENASPGSTIAYARVLHVHTLESRSLKLTRCSRHQRQHFTDMWFPIFIKSAIRRIIRALSYCSCQGTVCLTTEQLARMPIYRPSYSANVYAPSNRSTQPVFRLRFAFWRLMSCKMRNAKWRPNIQSRWLVEPAWRGNYRCLRLSSTTPLT